MPKFKESALAHKLLDGLEGLEIGGSAHNSFGLRTRNVDFTDRMDTVFKNAEREMCGSALPVDIVAPGDNLPLEDSSVDFVISSHVIEHFADPVKALKEWYRVVRPGGYIYVIAPHKERTFDKDRTRTTLGELIERHQTGKGLPNPDHEHCSFWITEDFVELVNWLEWPVIAVQDVDDKVGNGFTVVIRVEKGQREQPQRWSAKPWVDFAPAAQPAVLAAPPATPRAGRRMSMTFLMGPVEDACSGTAATAFEYIRRFQNRGHDVSIATWPKFLWRGAEPFPKLGFHVPIHFDRQARRESLPFGLLTKTPQDYIGELQFLYAYLNLLTPVIPESDLIIAVNWDTVIPAWQCRKGKPVHFLQDYDEVSFTLDGNRSAGLQGNPLIKMLCRSVLQMPVYRIANSSWLAGELRRRFQETVPVVKQGIDTELFHPRAKRSARDGVLRIVTHSSPDKWKGFQDAVAAMQTILQRYRGKVEWHVHGPEHPSLKPDNPQAPYTYHGDPGHEEVSRLYAESDILLFTAWCESFPLPPIQAMACGTAVVTTPLGTEDYAIEDHTALIARPRVISDLVLALDGLIRLPDLRNRFARNGRAMAESLSWDGSVKAREELLWRIHKDKLPNTLLQGLDNGLVDGFGIPFERLTPDSNFAEGELLHGTDGQHYVVDLGRLRRVADPAALGLDARLARTVDALALLRNAVGPELSSPADFYGLGRRDTKAAEPNVIR